MATTRFGYKEDLSLKNRKVGIGTSTANETLEVDGGIRGGGATVTGIATLTSYSGFDNTKFTNTENTNITGGESGTLSGEIVIGAGLTMSVGTGATSGQGSIECMKVYDTFNPPCGGTNGRPAAAKPGTIYYNKDFKTIEYWDGSFWRQVDNTTRRGRAIFFGGYYAPTWGSGKNGLGIEFFDIVSGGTTKDFGTYSAARTNTSGCGSAVRSLSASGFNGPGTLGSSNEIEYVTPASAGNAIDFGDRTATGYGGQATSSSTRGVFWGNREPNTNIIDYVEISTLGNALDFGDTPYNSGYKGAAQSPTRGYVAGARGPSGNNSSDIQVVTFSSKGNSVKFGDLTSDRSDNVTGASNSTTGIFSIGNNTGMTDEGGSAVRQIDKLNLASSGNAVSFGELNKDRHRCGGASNQTRAIFAGGFTSPGTFAYSSGIDSVTIASSGNGVDFGEMSPKGQFGATSDSHGGLGGY